MTNGLEKVVLTVDARDYQIITAALGELPFKVSAALLFSLEQQVKKQLEAQEKKMIAAEKDRPADVKRP